jgi:hypothetical protein
MNHLASNCYPVGMERDTIAGISVAAAAVLIFAALLAMMIFTH